jgi:arylsulfatase A-like enzyme
VSPDSVGEQFVRYAQGQPGVLRAASLTTLARSDTVTDTAARRWLHMYLPGGIAVATVTLTPGSVWGTRAAAEHGTPNDYDAHVPLIFLGPWFQPGHYARPVRIVDLAPTLAEVIGVKPSERLDGRVLPEALEARR